MSRHMPAHPADDGPLTRWQPQRNRALAKGGLPGKRRLRTRSQSASERDATRVTPVLGNIFADLGFPAGQAVDDLLDSRQRSQEWITGGKVVRNPSIGKLPLGGTTCYLLRAAGVRTLRDLCLLSVGELRRKNGIGPRRLQEILVAMSEIRAGFLPPYPKSWTRR